MKEIREGQILDVSRGIIVQQVNAQGVMGAGFAKDVRERWPMVYDAYVKHVGQPYTQKENGRNFLGDVIWVYINSGLWVANLVGQQFFGKTGGRYTSYDALDSGFDKIAIMAKANGLDVHYPLIGCGLGGGNWTIVSAIIDVRLNTINHFLWKLPQ